jgi:phage terminase large subunit-like protein
MCSAKTKVASCGRRWGKTEAAAVDASTFALLRPGSTQMIVSPTYDQSRLIFDTVERLILGSSLTRPVAKVVRTPYPRLTLGKSLIMARTADEDGRNLRGHAADRVIVDEAAYVKEAVIQEVISPMLADRNGELVMISTPFGKNHFYRTYLRGQGRGNRE